MPGGAYQADVLRPYLEFEVPHMARSAFYWWFDMPLEQIMEALAQWTLVYARAQQVDLSGPLCNVKDWYIVDSTRVTVRDALHEEFPGTGDYAAIQVHKVLSVGCRAPVHDHVSTAPKYDSWNLEIDASWQGCGLLANPAYASLTRLQACEARQVCFFIRLKETWKPKEEKYHRQEQGENGFTQMSLQQHAEQNKYKGQGPSWV